MSSVCEPSRRIRRKNKSSTSMQKDVFEWIVSSPLTKQDLEPPEQRTDLLNKAIDEIISSECTYQDQLNMLMNFFAQPLKTQAIINASSYNLLFGQIEMIQNLSAEFLREVEKDKQHLASAFLKMSPFFKLYSVYAFDYRNALLMVQELQQKNAAFRNFLEQTEMRPEVQRKLNSLMIAPIQRVPRYKLLLEKVLLYTSPAEPEYKMLKESVIQIESIITHINNCVEDQEVTQQLLNLQNSLLDRAPNIVRPSRKVLLEGVLNECTYRGDEKSRYCFLFTDMFMYCKILKERSVNTVVENSLESICIFPLKKCNVYQLFSDKFKITCHGYGIILGSKDPASTVKWINSLQDAINKHTQSRFTLRKDSSKRRPVRKRELIGFDSEHVLPAKRKKSNSECDKFSILDCFGQNASSAEENTIPGTPTGVVAVTSILKRKLSVDDNNKENINKCVKFTETIIEHPQQSEIKRNKPKSKSFFGRIYDCVRKLF